MDEEFYYTILYRPKYADSGVVSFEPEKIVRGHYNKDKNIFTEEKNKKEYFCCDIIFPDLGKNEEHVLDALKDEVEHTDCNEELLFAFPVLEKQLDEYIEEDPNVKDVPKEELYERLVRSYYLYSMYDIIEDDQYFYVADKFDDHCIYDVDITLDFPSAVNNSYSSRGEQNINVYLVNGSYAYEDELEEDEEDEKEHDDHTKKESKKITPETTTFTKIVHDFDPDELEKKVSSEVIGQEHVARPLISMLYKNKRYYEHDGLKSNMLILGPSGCGKTELARSIQRNTGIPVTFFDASSASASGYVGNSVTQAIRDLISVCNGDIEKAENGIIVIDEIDKLTGGDGISKGDVQDELFKMLEGDEITVSSENYRDKSFRFNPKNVTFIGVGAAQKLIEQKRRDKSKVALGFSASEPVQGNGEEEIIIEPEDLIKYGFKPELLRRFPIIKVVKDLKENDLVDILKNSEISNLRMYKKAFENVDHVKLVCQGDVLNEIARRAIKEKAGASGLKRVVDDALQVAVRKIRLLNGDQGELRIYKDTLDNPENFRLYRVSSEGKELVYPPKKEKSKVKGKVKTKVDPSKK